ncbi:hypothetical protein O3I_025260 [Nocardia brasiliensis ATCC 700358]|uniref:Uncharacterized protein n=1 Tax=Nocardia brasiliensis (strain ATCC 700358 / HUJEG-1) TaxID=1133849 RepID=K0ET70_NOCB7|nr:hypothetical protein O3I_025260 [Nocardia brasiliensis ATCC 700358]
MNLSGSIGHVEEFLPLAVLGTAALSEGVRFLYDQAGELLRRRRAGSDTESDPGTDLETPPIVTEPEQLPAPDMTQVERFEPELRALRSDLHEYAAGVDPVAPSDERLLHLVDALRRVLETIHGTPLVFAGEGRESAQVRGSIDADRVAGYVAAVRADRAEGTIEGHTRVREVAAGGQAIGVDLGADRRER